jgi:hypothetical protein
MRKYYPAVVNFPQQSTGLIDNVNLEILSLFHVILTHNVKPLK